MAKQRATLKLELTYSQFKELNAAIWAQRMSDHKRNGHGERALTTAHRKLWRAAEDAGLVGTGEALR